MVFGHRTSPPLDRNGLSALPGGPLDVLTYPALVHWVVNAQPMPRPLTDTELAADRITRRLDRPVGLLGVFALGLWLFEPFTTDREVLTFLVDATWAIVALVFVAEFSTRMIAAQNTWLFIRKHWWELALVALPFLRFLRAARAARAARGMAAAVRSSRRAGEQLQSRLTWLVLVTTVVALCQAVCCSTMAATRARTGRDPRCRLVNLDRLRSRLARHLRSGPRDRARRLFRCRHRDGRGLARSVLPRTRRGRSLNRSEPAGPNAPHTGDRLWRSSTRENVQANRPMHGGVRLSTVMGFRIRKSIGIAPGVRMTFSKSGIGYSAGVKGYRITKRADGQIQRTASIPGTGLSYVTTSRSGRRSTPPRYAASPARRATKPGWFAPKATKTLYKALVAQDIPTIERIGTENDSLSFAAASVLGILKLTRGDAEGARDPLEFVFASGKELADDPFITKHTAMRFELPVAEGITASLTLDRAAIGLALAEVYQSEDRFNDAVRVVEQLEPTTTPRCLSPSCTARLGITPRLCRSPKASPMKTMRQRCCAYSAESRFANSGCLRPLVSRSRRRYARRSGIRSCVTGLCSNVHAHMKPMENERWPARTSNGSWPRTPITKA